MTRSIILKISAFATLFFVAIFLLPVLSSAKLETAVNLLDNDNTLFKNTLIRGLVFSFIVSIVSVIVGYIIALSIRSITLSSKASNWLSVLFVPFLLGNVSVAFIFKLFFLQSDVMGFAFRSPFNTHLIVGLIQVWQYASLFAYLFWLSFQSLKTGLIEYASHAKFSKWEFQRDVLIPHIKSLFVLLFLLSFIFNFYEEAKFELIFRASQGTDTEPISRWLFRIFRGDMGININFASERIFSISLYVIIPIVFGAIILFASLLNKGVQLFCRTRLNLLKMRFSNKSSNVKYFFLVALCMLIAIPIINAYFTETVSFTNAFLKLYYPLLLSLFAAILATAFAVIFGIVSRQAWVEKLNSFNSFSIIFIGMLFLLLVVPPITLMISGFYWIRLLSISGSTAITFFWLLGHCFLAFPILGSFTLVNHFRVKSNELNFHRVHKASFIDVVKLSFLKRFRVEYLLTLMFAFSLIWNEAVLNRVFSSEIPSFISAIIDTVLGRNADFGAAMAYFSVSLFCATICVLLWLIVINRSKKNLVK